MFNNRLAGEELIIKSDKAINKGMDNIISYSDAGNQTAYLVKAIRENWQFPEEYLREKIKETEKKLPDFWKEKLNKTKIKGESSKLLEVVLEEKRREIIKGLIKENKICF